jgi:hypothetical protein
VSLDARTEPVRPDLSPCQQALLRTLPERFPPERIDRLWIFAPHFYKARETGFFVLSLIADEAHDAGPPHPTAGAAPPNQRRALVTLRYETANGYAGHTIRQRVTEEGWAPPEQIDRVIAGVLARSHTEFSDPFVEAIGGHPDRWEDLLTWLGLTA